MSTPVAIRFDEELLEDVRRLARRRGTTVSSVVQSFTDEGIRASRVPGIVFRDGPVGRRAGVAGSLDVWEVMTVVRETEIVDPQTLAADLGVPEHTIMVALDYYSQFPDEIDGWIADHDAETERAYTAWQRKMALP